MVDFHLDDGGVEHGDGAEDEAEEDLFDGCEADSSAAEGWVHEGVEDGDEDYEGYGVEVVQKIRSMVVRGV